MSTGAARPLFHALAHLQLVCHTLIKRGTAQHLKTMTIATAFTAKVATLDSASLRSLYKQLFNQPLVPFQCLDIVLNRMMDLDGVQAVDAFIETVS